MLELSHADKWLPVPETGAKLQGAGVTALVAPSPEGVLVSGDLAAFARRSDGVSLRLARDCALVLGPTGLATGWHDEGFALSNIGAGLALVQLSGPDLGLLVAKATTTDPDNIGAANSITFAGVPAIMGGQGDAIDLYLERGLLAYLWGWISAALREPQP